MPNGKEVQEIFSCRGNWGVPQLFKVPVGRGALALPRADVGWFFNPTAMDKWRVYTSLNPLSRRRNPRRLTSREIVLNLTIGREVEMSNIGLVEPNPPRLRA